MSFARHEYLLNEISRVATSLELPTQPNSSADLRVPVAIAGVRVDLLTRSRELHGQASRYFQQYFSDSPAEATIHLEPLAARSDTGEIWEDPDPEFSIQGDAVIQRDFVARRKGARAVAFVAPALTDAFHNLLRWFLPPLLLEQGRFLLHGAAAIRNGGGYVFFGKSGAGKSTVAGLISGTDPLACVIGDDSVIIGIEDGNPFVYPAPLGCGYSDLAPPAQTAPLRGLFALEQDGQDTVEALTPSEGVAALLGSAMSLRAQDAIEARFDLALRFANSDVGISRLRFTETPRFWPLLLEVRETEASVGHRRGTR